MARKPVDLIAAAQRPEGRQIIWQTMRKLRKFTVSDIEGATRINEGTIRTYVRGLERAGYIKRFGRQDRSDSITHVKGSFAPMIYDLVRDTGIEAPRVTRQGGPVTQGRAREYLWRTLRIIGEFSYRDLAVQAATDEQPIVEADARDYVKHLHRAGYLVATTPAKPGNKPGTGSPARYRLLPSKYTGPLPPMVQRVKQVFDPNLGKVVWPNDQKGGAK